MALVLRSQGIAKGLKGMVCTREEEGRIREFLKVSLGPGEEIRQVLPLAGDASDRRYFGVHGKTDEYGLTPTYVVMVLDHPWKSQDGMEELPFINIASHLARHGIPVPEIYHYDSPQGMLLLEDLGDSTLQKSLHGSTWTEQRRYYKEAISLLVAMQAAKDPIEGSPCYALHRAFDAERFFNELMFFLEHAIEGLWSQKLPSADRKALEDHFMALCRQIAPVADAFTHRDYHSRNLMVKEGRLRILDFQDARMGTIYYDLASLVRDSYMALPEEAMFELIDYYRERAPRDLITVDYTQFLEAFDRTSIQRNLKAVGTFAYQACTKGRDHYLQYIPRTLHYVRSNLLKYQDLRDLKRLLEQYVRGLR